MAMLALVLLLLFSVRMFFVLAFLAVFIPVFLLVFMRLFTMLLGRFILVFGNLVVFPFLLFPRSLLCRGNIERLGRLIYYIRRR
jgi:hypothetical protein